jgi:hypothetical protein
MSVVWRVSERYAVIAATRSAVAPIPATKPDASRRCGEQSATQMSAAAATGRAKRPIEKPVTKLNVIRNPARLHARNHHHPWPPGLPCRLHARPAATKTSSGQAKIISSLNVTPLKKNGLMRNG